MSLTSYYYSYSSWCKRRKITDHVPLTLRKISILGRGLPVAVTVICIADPVDTVTFCSMSTNMGPLPSENIRLQRMPLPVWKIIFNIRFTNEKKVHFYQYKMLSFRDDKTHKTYQRQLWRSTLRLQRRCSRVPCRYPCHVGRPALSRECCSPGKPAARRRWVSG